MVVFSLGMLLAGVFPEDYGGGAAHSNASSLAFLAGILVALLLGTGLRKAEPAAWGRYRTFSRVCGLVSFVLLVVFGRSTGSGVQGAAQRAFIAGPWI